MPAKTDRKVPLPSPELCYPVKQELRPKAQNKEVNPIPFALTDMNFPGAQLEPGEVVTGISIRMNPNNTENPVPKALMPNEAHSFVNGAQTHYRDLHPGFVLQQPQYYPPPPQPAAPIPQTLMINTGYPAPHGMIPATPLYAHLPSPSGLPGFLPHLGMPASSPTMPPGVSSGTIPLHMVSQYSQQQDRNKLTAAPHFGVSVENPPLLNQNSLLRVHNPPNTGFIPSMNFSPNDSTPSHSGLVSPLHHQVAPGGVVPVPGSLRPAAGSQFAQEENRRKQKLDSVREDNLAYVVTDLSDEEDTPPQTMMLRTQPVPNVPVSKSKDRTTGDNEKSDQRTMGTHENNDHPDDNRNVDYITISADDLDAEMGTHSNKNDNILEDDNLTNSENKQNNDDFTKKQGSEKYVKNGYGELLLQEINGAIDEIMDETYDTNSRPTNSQYNEPTEGAVSSDDEEAPVEKPSTLDPPSMVPFRYTARNKRMKCPKCNYSTDMWHKYREHMKAHKGNIKCLRCGKAFIKTCDLVRHNITKCFLNSPPKMPVYPPIGRTMIKKERSVLASGEENQYTNLRKRKTIMPHTRSLLRKKAMTEMPVGNTGNKSQDDGVRKTIEVFKGKRSGEVRLVMCKVMSSNCVQLIPIMQDEIENAKKRGELGSIETVILTKQTVPVSARAQIAMKKQRLGMV